MGERRIFVGVDPIVWVLKPFECDVSQRVTGDSSLMALRLVVNNYFLAVRVSQNIVYNTSGFNTQT
ncbi:MAG: hypothetical protein QW688_00220 [Thermoprotei archaeon]